MNLRHSFLFLASETEEKSTRGEHFAECGKEPPFRCLSGTVPLPSMNIKERKKGRLREFFCLK